MDEGFVTGSNGKRADARNCFVIPQLLTGAPDAEKRVIGFGGNEFQMKQQMKNTRSFLQSSSLTLLMQYVSSTLNEIAKRKVCPKFISNWNNNYVIKVLHYM